MTKLEVNNGRVTDTNELRRCPDCAKMTVTEWTYCPFCGVEL